MQSNGFNLKQGLIVISVCLGALVCPAESKQDTSIAFIAKTANTDQ